MGPVLLDTDVFSFIFKRDSRAKAYEPYLTATQLSNGRGTAFLVARTEVGRCAPARVGTGVCAVCHRAIR